MTAVIPGDRESANAASEAAAALGGTAAEFTRNAEDAQAAGDKAGARFWSDMARKAAR